jgi:hypothetical protein
MKRNLFLMLASLSVVLYSCYQDIDMETYRPEPDLVLNGILSADTTVMLSISRTKFFTDTDSYEVVRDANVSLSVNGVFSEQMQWVADESFYGGGIYASGYKPQTGDLIRIEAITTYGEAWVEETIPQKVRIEDVAFSHKEIYDHKGYRIGKNGELIEVPTHEITYRITFADKIETADYYCIRIDNPEPPFNMGNLDYSSDPLFIEQVSVVDGLFGGKTIQGQGGRSFTDQLINGQHYTLIVKEICHDYEYAPTLDRRIILYTITESYYHYLTSIQTAVDAANSINLSTFGFAEPVRIFTNIHGGIGIMATSQHDIVSVKLK